MGLVHCDVKPGNVILNNHGAVKVLDFGVSKTVFEEQKKGFFVERQGYMAHEQINQGKWFLEQISMRWRSYFMKWLLPSRCSLVKRRRIRRSVS